MNRRSRGAPRPAGVAGAAAMIVLPTLCGAQPDSQSAVRFFGTGAAQQDRVRIRIDDDAPGPNASAPCDAGAASFSLDFWVRGTLADNPSANAGGDRQTADAAWITGNIVVDRDIFGGSERDWGVSIAGGFVRFGTGRGDGAPQDPENTIEGSVNVLDGAWHHVAVTRDAATGIKRLYVDGLLDFSSSSNVSKKDLSYPDNGAPGQATPWGPYIVLGAEKHDAGAAFPSFNGSLDEFRVWNTALTQSQILDRYDRVIAPGTAGLVAYYRFEEGAGTAVNDSSSAGSPVGELIAGIPGNGQWVLASQDSANTAPVSAGSLPHGFTRTQLPTAGLTEPTVLEFLPDGRLLIAQRNGTIRLFSNGSLLAQPLVALPANTVNGERGLSGLVKHPDFAANGYIYCYWTTNEPRNRVSRLTVSGNTAPLASEFVVWQNFNTAGFYHHAGCLAFGNDGNLYISTGDAFTPSNAQSLANEHGKILRVRPDGTIPPDNPFVGTGGARPTIWALGLRNPFRFSIDGPTGRIYIGNVGGNNPGSWEEVNLGAAGANYGWPNQEGPECYVADCSAYTYPIFYYRRNDPRYYYQQPQASITMGPVYRSTAFPPAFRGSLFFGDYSNFFIRRLVFDAAGNVAGDPVFLRQPEASTIVDLKVSPDGAIYYADYDIDVFGNPSPGGAAVFRIAYPGAGNAPPIAVASAQPTLGQPPLSVAFSSAGSSDPDGGPGALTFLWDFGDSTTSTLPNPQHTYSTRGQYTATLTVGDGAASAASAPLTIRVGTPPVPIITLPASDTTYTAGQTVLFAGTADDAEDGPLSAPAFTWNIVLVHAGHTHPFFGPVSGVTSGEFAIPTVGHGPEGTHYRVDLVVEDTDGLTALATRDILPVVSTLALDTDPTGIPVFLDGEPVATPRQYQSVLNHRHRVEPQGWYVLDQTAYTLAGWADGGARVRTIVMPAPGAALTALYLEAPENNAVSAVPADNRNAEYTPGRGQQYSDAFDPFGLCFGRDASGPYQVGLQFALDVPRGAPILAASISMTATADQSGAPEATIRAYDAGAALPFIAGSPVALDDFQPLTGASVAWSPPPFNPGESHATPDLAPLVQEVVGRADWSAGNMIGFVLDGSGSTEGAWRCLRNLASGQPAFLSVTYAIIPPPCPPDFNGDGFLDGIDYDLFHNLFEAGDLSADYNADGFVDGIDSDQFNNDFEAGCQ